ncbi:MAG: FtsX-like permease family protein [Candidatus Cloacimonetes bacterium]|nr:FtsX-like permease family protein [Candidatus Cloacimonadota bacterium]
MSFLTTSYRVLKNTFQHLSRNPWHSLAAVLVMALTFFITSIFILVAMGSNKVLKYFEEKPQVTAFFKDTASDDYILQVKENLEKTGKTSEVRFISKSEALQIYRQQNITEPELLEFVTADILPASLQVSAKDISYLTEIARLFSNDTQVEKVIFQKDVVAALQNWTKNARLIGMGLIAFLALVSILIVLAIISINISDFGQEIEIMRLVGAGKWYIRWPFLLDGIIFGVAASLFASIVLLLILPAFSSWTQSIFTGIDAFSFSKQVLLNLWAITTGFGMSLGIIGSSAAIYRHLRV